MSALHRLAPLFYLAQAFALRGEDAGWFGIHVVDDATGRGVPLVELRTVNDIALVTDSAGWVAFQEPGLTAREVYFHIESPGYEYPKDGLGNRGVRLAVAAGSTAEVKLHRTAVAERVVRLTGQGIYRDSTLLGRPTPLAQPNLNAGVLGQDSVQTVPYRDRLFWLWGDTNLPNYPLGNFHTTAATTPLDSRPERLDFAYFTIRRTPTACAAWSGKLSPAPFGYLVCSPSRTTLVNSPCSRTLAGTAAFPKWSSTALCASTMPLAFSQKSPRSTWRRSGAFLAVTPFTSPMPTAISGTSSRLLRTPAFVPRSALSTIPPVTKHWLGMAKSMCGAAPFRPRLKLKKLSSSAVVKCPHLPPVTRSLMRPLVLRSRFTVARSHGANSARSGRSSRCSKVAAMLRLFSVRFGMRKLTRLPAPGTGQLRLPRIRTSVSIIRASIPISPLTPAALFTSKELTPRRSRIILLRRPATNTISSSTVLIWLTRG